MKSVLLGRDCEALKILIPLHCKNTRPRILDVTYNQGTMWKGTGYKPLSMDIDSQFQTDIVGSYLDFPPGIGVFDVIVFDPPHLTPDASSLHASKVLSRRYSVAQSAGTTENVCVDFFPFLLEAKRALKPSGIVLAKIADITHNHKYQWQHVEFILAARQAGLTPCDMLIKADPSAGKLMSSKWKNTYHLRKAHCYWIVIRNSEKCEAR